MLKTKTYQHREVIVLRGVLSDYHIKAFGQIQQAEKRDFSLVKCGQDMVRDGSQRGFGE